MASPAASIDPLSPIDRLRRELLRPPFNLWLAPVAIRADEPSREIAVSLPFRPEFSYDPARPIFHGGVIAALADLTGYAAVAVWHGGVTPTIALNVDYLAPAIGQELVARGMLRKLGRSVARADIEVSADGKLVALGRGTFATGDART